MAGLNNLLEESLFIAYCLEGLLCGIYSGMFFIYLQHQGFKNCKKAAIIFYLLFVLYALSVALIAIDVTRFITEMLSTDESDVSRVALLFVFSTTISGCCDFIAQCILIYRCWIVWNRNIRVVIIPSILAFAFLATWLAAVVEDYYSFLGQTVTGYRGLIVTSLALPLAVNTVVTGLIVFKIFTVYRKVKPILRDQRLSTISRRQVRPIIFILIESGMALFSIQLARLVLDIVPTTTADIVYQPIYIMQQMVNGMTPTIIQVRVIMGLSFHDTQSMVEVTSNLHSVSDYSDSKVSETTIINIVRQESINSDNRDNDD